MGQVKDRVWRRWATGAIASAVALISVGVTLPTAGASTPSPVHTVAAETGAGSALSTYWGPHEDGWDLIVEYESDHWLPFTSSWNVDHTRPDVLAPRNMYRFKGFQSWPSGGPANMGFAYGSTGTYINVRLAADGQGNWVADTPECKSSPDIKCEFYFPRSTHKTVRLLVQNA